LAPRGGFEPPSFRLTAEKPTSSELAGVGPNRRKSASYDETSRIISPSLFTFHWHLAAIYHHEYYIFMASQVAVPGSSLFRGPDKPGMFGYFQFSRYPPGNFNPVPDFATSFSF
jgi:hypothetical protein